MFCNLECLLLISGFSGVLFLARALKNRETTENFDNLIFRSEGPLTLFGAPLEGFCEFRMQLSKYCSKLFTKSSIEA